MNVDINFKSEARKKLAEGIEIVSKVASETMGKEGNYTIVKRPYGSPKATKDGYYSIKNIKLADEQQQQGVLMIQEGAKKTAEEAGDGSTTFCVITNELVKMSNTVIEAGMSQVSVKKGIEIGVKLITEELTKMAIKVDGDNKMIKQVATISANNNEEIGRDIAFAMSKIKSNGIITALPSKSMDSFVEIVDGMKISRGFISPYFITNPDRMECVMENPYILIHDDIISGIAPLVPILEEVTKQGRGMLIIAKEVNNEALATLIQNKVKAGLKLACVFAPGYGASFVEELEDLAIVLGATVVTEKTGITLDTCDVSLLGQADKVIITRNSTEFVGSKGDKDLITERIKGIRINIKSITDANVLAVANKRLANMDGGVAVLNIGGVTEMEVSEKLDLVEDAIEATKSAVAMGVVPGGGSSLVLASKVLAGYGGEHSVGVDIVRKAIQSPLKQIMNNAGLVGDVILDKVLTSKLSNAGYNLNTGMICNMIKEGILDTAKVEISALTNAASIANLVIMTSSLVTYEDVENK